MRDNYAKKGLISGFMRSLSEFPDRPALDVDDRAYTYKELARESFKIAQAIRGASSGNPFVALLGYRSITAYAGVIGILASGKGYVPLNPNFPAERILNMLELASCDILIVGKECMKAFRSIQPKLDESLTIIFSDTESEDDSARGRSGRSLFLNESADASPEIPDIAPEATAYLLFTSGSTGVPKGVPVSHGNARSFIDYICGRYGIDEQDRFSQTADMNFDLSVLEIFPCWEKGACLCCLPKKSVMAPAKYIKEKRLTVWISVPSVGVFMTKMRLLNPGAFPALRYCLFCGEPLLAASAENWQNAAPNAIVENLYGPTEATVAITAYKWNNSESPSKCRGGVVPIGWVFEGQSCCLIDHEFNVVGQGKTGELCLSGSQVTKGYFNCPDKTIHHYIQIPSFGNRLWYRTGDLAFQDEDGCLHYMGRVDNQVKILGYRVELQEIDSVLRKASGSDLSICVPLSNKDGGVEAIAGFICGGNTRNSVEILGYCSRFLPSYMIPRGIFFIDDMPLNSNGKIDRIELAKRVKAEDLP